MLYDDPLNARVPVENVSKGFTEQEHVSDPIPVSPAPNVVSDDDEIEECPDYDFNGFQVVRSEFFAQLREPSISFSQGKVGVNSACLKKLPNVDYAQILINRQKQLLAVRPCQETDIFSFQWCTYRKKDNKRQPRQVNGKLFFMKICALMKWNPDNRYKILGKLIHANNEYLFVFDLKARQTFVRKQSEDGKKITTSRTPLFPAEWQDQFGIPFEEHTKALQINMFDGFAIYSVKEDSSASPLLSTPPSDLPQQQPQQGGDFA